VNVITNQKAKRALFYMGIVFVLVAAVLLLGDFMKESAFAAFLGAMGVIFIAASKFRPLK
jgi:hypothetical protein